MDSGIIINGWNSLTYGIALADGWKISAPKRREATVTIPGRDGVLDFSTALTGYPVYGTRTISFTLIPPYWLEREDVFDIYRKLLSMNGVYVDVELPDVAGYHWNGVLKATRTFERFWTFPCSLTSVYPYCLKNSESTLTAAVSGQVLHVVNIGDEPAVPTITTTASVNIMANGASHALSSGIFRDTAFRLKPNTDNQWTVSGSGTITVTWQEGILA